MGTNRVIPQSHYYSGQGRLIIGERDPKTGRPINLREVGNCTALELTVQTTKSDHKESMSGERAIDLTLVTEKSATFKFTCESVSLENLALGLWGSIQSSEAATVVDQEHKVGPGALIALPHQMVTTVTIMDKAAVPVAVPAGMYSVDPEFGTIRFSNDYVATGVGVDLGVVSISYEAEADIKTLHGLTEVMPPERFVRFEGINTVDGDLVLVEIPRSSFEPLASLPLINDELASFEVTGTALRDNLIVTDGSKYYRQTYLKSAA